MTKFFSLLCLTTFAQLATSQGIFPKLPQTQNRASETVKSFYGRNLVWTYHRNGVSYPMVLDKAENNGTLMPSQYHFTQSGANVYIEVRKDNSPRVFLLEVTEGLLRTYNNNYELLILDPDVSDPEGQSFFLRSRHGNGRFVTPNSRPPFTFYVKNRYPDEPDAAFTLAPFVLNVEESYAGIRERIIPTADLIEAFENGNERRDELYANLIQLMTSFGHLPGEEIFQLGYHIFDTIGSNRSSFALLPPVVQVVCGGNSARLLYREPVSKIDFGMKNVLASRTHSFVLPYTFGYNRTSNLHFTTAITYQPSNQLSIALNELVYSNNSAKIFSLDLHLLANLETFAIKAYTFENKFLIAKESSDSGEYSFELEDFLFPPAPAEFLAIPYAVNVSDMYGGIRENIVPTAIQIQQSETEDEVSKSAAFEELIKFMTEFGHLAGKEIFEVGHIIKEELGAVSPAFNKLPAVVQRVCTGGPVRIFFQDADNQALPLKDYDASANKEFILPYELTPQWFWTRAGQTIQWALTYGVNTQLYVFNNALISRVSTALSNVFVFVLEENLSTFVIEDFVNHQSDNRPLSSDWNSVTDSYFFGTGNPARNISSFDMSAYILDVEDMYGGKRENIVQTAELIQASPFLGKPQAYKELLDLMQGHNQVAGEEIFYLAQIIAADLGNASATFDLLPTPVKLVTNRTPLSLNYSRDGSNYPLKYATADDLHSNILGYKFTYSAPLKRFALSYGSDFQLIVPTTGITTGELIESKTSLLQSVFFLHLAEDLRNIHIRCWHNSQPSSNPLETRNVEPGFSFHCNPYAATGDTFSILEY